jgi:hypothetical protein
VRTSHLSQCHNVYGTPAFVPVIASALAPQTEGRVGTPEWTLGQRPEADCRLQDTL